jgi:hypothetical protein
LFVVRDTGQIAEYPTPKLVIVIYRFEAGICMTVTFFTSRDWTILIIGILGYEPWAILETVLSLSVKLDTAMIYCDLRGL